MVEKISAVTLRVANMWASVMLYMGPVGLEVAYSGEDAHFSSLSTKDGTDPILNLEQGKPVLQWGRLIFRVSNVDLFWAYLIERGLRPESPRDAFWGERYFHLWDPDGHELSFRASDQAITQTSGIESEIFEQSASVGTQRESPWRTTRF